MKMTLEQHGDLVVNKPSNIYRVSPWWYLLAFGNAGMGVFAGLLYLLFPESNLPAVSEFTFLGLGFVSFAIFALWKLRSAYVFVDEGTLRFKFGRKISTINLSGVNRIIVKGAFIILDEGTIPRFVIPRVFSNEVQLVDKLQECINHLSAKS